MDEVKKVKYIEINGSKYCPGPSKTSEIVNDSSYVNDASMINYVEQEVQRLTDEDIDDLLN